MKTADARTPEHALALPASPGGVLATRPDLAARAAHIVGLARAGASKRALASDWRIFEHWCAQNGAVSLPATTETVFAFLTEVSATRAFNTVMRYRASISTAHRLANQATPAYHPQIRTLIEGMRRAPDRKPERPKVALPQSALAEPAEAREVQTVRDVRDRALLLLGFASAMRRSELCAIDVAHLRWRPGGLVILLPRSKTDQQGEGRSVYVARGEEGTCPVAAVERWMSLLRRKWPHLTGPVFRAVGRGNIIFDRRLRPPAVATTAKRAASLAGIDPRTVGGHSLRAGYVTHARLNGADWGAIMDTTGHRKIETVRRYDRGGPEADDARIAAARRVLAPVG